MKLRVPPELQQVDATSLTKQKTVSPITWIVAIVAIACAFVGFCASQARKQPDEPSAAAPAETPAISVQAVDLSAAYERNVIAADAKYKGQVLVVTGTVQNIGKDITNTAYVALDGVDQVHSVQCMFDDSWLAKLGKLSPGDQVSIRGTDEGGALVSVILRHSELQ